LAFSQTPLSERSGSRENNLLLMRLILASAVLFTHAYLFVQGSVDHEPLYEANGVVTCGFLAVDIFFILSGFLIVKSWMDRQNAPAFLLARAFRIYPALWTNTILVLIVGFIISGLSFAAFFTDATTWKWFLKNMTLIYTAGAELPGVFVNNVYPRDTNIQFWTLSWEIRMYVVTAIVGMLGLFRYKWVILGITIALLGGYYCGIEQDPYGFSSWIRLPAFFMMGGCYYLFREHVNLNWKAFGIILASLVLCLILRPRQFEWMYVLPLPYLTFCLAYLPKGWFTKFDVGGDYSYGIYIYGGFVGQLVAMNHNPNIFLHFLEVFAITLILAVASWHLVEKRALKAPWRFQMEAWLTRKFSKQPALVPVPDLPTPSRGPREGEERAAA